MRHGTTLLSPSLRATFVLLGPVEVRRGTSRFVIGRRRERGLLAVLLLEVNRVVPVGRLVDLLWDGDPPASARAALHTHVSRLRAQLDPDGDGRYGVRLHARAGGYLIEAYSDTIDAHRFTAMVEKARREVDATVRAAVLRRALSLWHGPALDGAGSDLLRTRVAANLDELRMEAIEAALDAELACGRHDWVVGEAKRLIAEHPLREALWARLSLALYRSGRQDEALAGLALIRRRLAEELGVDPGPALRRLHHEIITADPALDAGVPRQLPMDIPEFTGREAELRRVADWAREPCGPVICAVEGMPGVGKTRFAVHAAHRLAERFDEAQLWADLHGFDRAPPADPAATLETFLRLLGVPEPAIPYDLEARAALYRSRLAGRRALVLLDNAADAEQVRPLLPGSGHSLVLVTSRRRLSGLDGVRPVSLDAFSPTESAGLIAALAGDERLTGQAGETNRLAELCGHLPLAVAVAARHLRAHPSWSVSDLTIRLAPLLREALRETFELSYRALSPSQQHLLRLLTLQDGDLADDRAAVLLDEHLATEVSPGRYRLHPLVRRLGAGRGVC